MAGSGSRRWRALKRGRPRWHDRLRPAARQRLNDGIDADVECAAEIFRRLNLRRYCHYATFTKYVATRRRDREARRGTPSARPVSKLVTLGDLMVAALEALIAIADSGRARGYALREVRFLIRDIGALLEMYGNAGPR